MHALVDTIWIVAIFAGLAAICAATIWLHEDMVTLLPEDGAAQSAPAQMTASNVIDIRSRRAPPSVGKPNATTAPAITMGFL